MAPAFAAPAAAAPARPARAPRCSFVGRPAAPRAPAARRSRVVVAVAASEGVNTRLANSTKRIILDEPLATPGGWFVECEVRDDALDADDPKAATRYVARRPLYEARC